MQVCKYLLTAFFFFFFFWHAIMEDLLLELTAIFGVENKLRFLPKLENSHAL